MKRRMTGFTTVEILTVVAILIVLAAIGWPLLSSVKERAKETRSMSNMRQICLALAQYRADWEAGGGSDAIISLGLPPSLYALYRDRKLPRSIFETGGTSPLPGGPAVYTWIVPPPGKDDGHPSWKEYFAADGEEAVFLVDETFGNEPGARFHPFQRHHVIGAHLDGHVKVKEGLGDYTSYDFWRNGG